MPDTPPCKAELRKVLRERRRNLDSRAQLAAADAVANHITRLPGWPTAERVALYLAADGEVDTAPLGTLCRNAGKQLYLPVIDAQGMLTFASWREADELVPNRYGIPEPPHDAPRCVIAELDIIVLPLVAWDRSGGRLGMGGGFYDRTLAASREALLVGLAHAVQEVPRVPCDDWDVILDVIVTESFVHCCRQRR